MPPSPSPRSEGDCFQVALDRLLELHLKGESGSWLLCHGKVTGQGLIEGLRIEHAWLEEMVHFPNFPSIMALVWDHSNGRVFEGPAALYYFAGQIRHEEVKRYTFGKARAMVTKHGHYGPWEDTDAERSNPEDAVVRDLAPSFRQEAVQSASGYQSSPDEE